MQRLTEQVVSRLGETTYQLERKLRSSRYALHRYTARTPQHTTNSRKVEPERKKIPLKTRTLKTPEKGEGMATGEPKWQRSAERDRRQNHMSSTELPDITILPM